jgi:hypothetical protein
MFGHQPSKPATPPDSIDFELTDFEDARHALEELPPGIESVKNLRPGYWEQQRRKPLATDRALTGGSMEWVISLPPTLRPHTLCEQFPRIVNLVAECWPDVSRSSAILDQLVNDRRGNRRGFPPAVQTELAALQNYLQERQPR